MTNRQTKTREAAAPAPAGSLFDQLGQLPDDLEEPVQTAPIVRAVPATSTAVAIPREPAAMPPSIHQMAMLDPVKAMAYLEARAKAVEMIGAVAIKSTVAQDWTLFKDKEGKVVGVLRDSGAVKVRKWMGIRIFGHRPTPEQYGQASSEPRVTKEQEPKDGGGFVDITVCELWADGDCQLTGEMVEGVFVGLRSADGFVGRGTIQDLKASCRTSLDTKIVRILSGLRKVDADTLTRSGIDVEKCYKGSGFGNARERAAGRVADGGDLAEKKAAIKADILKRVGGDESAAKLLLKDITSYQGKGEHAGKTFFKKSVDEFTEGWQIDKAFVELKKHPTFGDANTGREPGAEG